MQVNAQLDEIQPRKGFAHQHPLDSCKVAAIIKHVQEAGRWALPAILVIEDEGNGYTLLDGHHRAEAARQLNEQYIPAYVVSTADYCAVIDAEFDGYAPTRLADLDDYILVEGQPYKRQDDGHE